MSTPDEQIATALAPVVEPLGLVVEQARTKRAGKYTSLEVVIDLEDGPGGLDDTTLAEATRALSTAVDELDPISGTYTLEVTTPGIDRPLETPRHFRRASGRLAELSLSDGTTLRGRIDGATDEDVTLTVGDSHQAVPLEAITSAHQVIEW